MKNKIDIIRSLVCFSALLLFIQACKQEPLMTYNSPNSIYFTWTSPSTIADSININFGYTPDSRSDTTVRFVLRCTGKPSDQDREIALLVDEGTTAKEGVHFLLPEKFLLRAGMVSDTLFVKILRDVSLKDRAYILKIGLLDNENFNTRIVSRQLSYRLFLSDIVSRPSWWSEGAFGLFSQKKMQLMVELLGIDPVSITGLSTDEQRFYGVFVQRYLNTMEEAGTPIYEEDGSKMTMGIDVLS